MFLKKISDNSDNSEPWSSKVVLLLRFIVFMSSAWDCDRQSSRPRRYAANLSIPICRLCIKESLLTRVHEVHGAPINFPTFGHFFPQLENLI